MTGISSENDKNKLIEAAVIMPMPASTTTVTESERFQLSRQDAAINPVLKNYLERTDDLLSELDDDFEPFTRDELEENEPIGPLKKPMISLYNLRSPAAIKSSFDSSTTIVNGTTTFACNGSSNPPLGTLEKSVSLSYADSFPPSPGEHNHNSTGGHYPTSSSTASHHHWRLSPMRSSYLPNGGIPRQQSTLDESGPMFIQGSSDGLCNGNSDKSLRVCENGIHNGENKLQQSLSTPCPTGTVATTNNRKDSEYRRFKSEDIPGSGGTPAPPSMDIAIDDLSPITDHRSSPPHRLFATQDSVSGPITKHSHTEQVMMMHTLKTKLQKYQGFIDKAFQLIQQGGDEQIFEGCTIVTKVMTKAWLFPKISHDLAYALCDYLRDQNYFDILIGWFVKPVTCESVRLCCGRVLEECLSLRNREYVVTKGYLKKVATTAEKLNKNQEQQRMSLSIMESLFKHSTSTTYKLIEFGVLDHILLTCKRATEAPATLRQAALALANLSLYSCPEAKKKIIQKKLPDWLFLLASQRDEATRYYACLAICVLGSCKEMEAAVQKSGTLSLVEPFLISHQPITFADIDYKHSQGRPKEWLVRLLPLLGSKCREAKCMAAFHFCVEAAIKKDQNKLEILQEIGATSALKEVASSPDEVAAKFASDALTIIGEAVPYKLTQQVPNWTTGDVQYWVEKIGFGGYKEAFLSNLVDGDLLLLLTEKELEEDLGISSGILRKRFMRELESLKIAADYSSVDESQLDQFLMSLSPELSVYTYQMLGMGLNRNFLPHLTNDMMKTVCGINNPVHRLKLRQALQDSKHIDDIEVAILSKQIDVFISYRRSTGNQLASLIKVLLQLRGYKVFIDVDKLYAGKFDSHLLKNIQAAKHFILVLTPNSLDRLLNDNNCEDWIHKELRCAFEHHKNVIPIFDQAFEFPEKTMELPDDIRQITRFNGVRWVHDYQEACIDKVERFIKGELNRMPSLGSTVSLRNPSQTASTTSTTVTRKNNYNLSRTKPSSGAGTPSSTATTTPAPTVRVKTTTTTTHLDAHHPPISQQNSSSNNSNNNNSSAINALAGRSASMEKQRRKLISSSVSTVCSANSER
uniref:ADP-ribosyl cyclase/cyclic ADP-ribose hydrolase n=1 Tax=Panagrolaimus sp. PS1159 TaxID=55785 RepID=A0AC35F708_9BILA